MARVRLLQLAPQVGEPERNQRLILDAIRDAGDVDLLVLPELVSSGYMLRDTEEARQYALSASGPEIAAWISAIPGQVIVVCGFPERGDDAVVHNSSVMFDRSGVLAVYRKVHLWDDETHVFSPGTEPAPIITTSLGRLGMMICYDIEFPEYTRTAALAGADALVVPTNWPLVPRPAGEHAPEVVIAQAAARVNRMAMLLCDRSGTERGQEWTSGTCVIGHDGWLVAEANADGVLDCEIDLTAGRDKHISKHNDLFTDRRPAVYRL